MKALKKWKDIHCLWIEILRIERSHFFSIGSIDLIQLIKTPTVIFIEIETLFQHLFGNSKAPE